MFDLNARQLGVPLSRLFGGVVNTEFPVLRIPNIEPGHVNAQDIKFGTLRANAGRIASGDVGDEQPLHVAGSVDWKDG